MVVVNRIVGTLAQQLVHAIHDSPTPHDGSVNRVGRKSIPNDQLNRTALTVRPARPFGFQSSIRSGNFAEQFRFRGVEQTGNDEKSIGFKCVGFV